MSEGGEREQRTPDMIQRVLDEGTASVEDLAREAGLSPHSLWAWANERRNPSPESLRQLADALEGRSGRLKEISGQLRDEARKREGGSGE